MNRERANNVRRIVVFLLILLVSASSAWGYVVFLKDGTQIITREKYRREGDKVYLTLQSGTETFIAASEIDFAKTEEANADLGAGQARLIEGQKVIDPGTPPPREEKLADIAGERTLSLPAPSVQQDPKIPLTTAGFVDLGAVARRAPQDLEVSDELTRYFTSQGITRVTLFQGTAADRLLVEAVVDSESAVFKILRDSASGLVQLRARFPQRLAALELYLETDEKARAGQFSLTPDLAEMLVSGRLDAPIFFYRYVEF